MLVNLNFFAKYNQTKRFIWFPTIVGNLPAIFSVINSRFFCANFILLLISPSPSDRLRNEDGNGGEYYYYCNI